MRRSARLTGLAAALVPGLAWAGPPFLTDDPEPTETSHWEIYAPAFDADGRGRDFEGTFGAEINYGAAKNLQLTFGLPGAYGAMHDGVVDEQWAKEHHGIWYEEVKQGKRPEKFVGGTPQPVPGDD